MIKSTPHSEKQTPAVVVGDESGQELKKPREAGIPSQGFGMVDFGGGPILSFHNSRNTDGGQYRPVPIPISNTYTKLGSADPAT